jgi:hypothetical protein
MGWEHGLGELAVSSGQYLTIKHWHISVDYLSACAWECTGALQRQPSPVGNMASVNWLSPQGPDFFPDAQLDDLLLLGISAGVVKVLFQYLTIKHWHISVDYLSACAWECTGALQRVINVGLHEPLGMAASAKLRYTPRRKH